mmetsp:Transcript_10793/g.23833  ORF Transcript_10793/g.23833 Transcript_10793/m.23833 type:complete len:549 (-) Transcript_10793:51-1697(-)
MVNAYLAVLLPAVWGRIFRRVHDVDVDVDTDNDNDADLDSAFLGTWIPIHPPNEAVFYYNPVVGRSVVDLPRGARITLAVQTGRRNQTDGNITANETQAANATTPSNETANATTTSYPTIVPLAERKSCVPHCAWSCSEPVCEQSCTPFCSVPQCETRCPKLGSNAFQQCQVKCGEPSCAMFCPKDPCQGKKTLDCNTPKCSTRCENPKCQLDCSRSHGMGCKTVCPDPQCKWICKKPKACPKPQCKMVCEQPPECVTSGRLSIPPPMPKGWQTASKSKKARVLEPKWVISDWGLCNKRCGHGVKRRRVYCNTHHDEDCDAEVKPETWEHCEDYSACDYEVGIWSDCNVTCGTGSRSRTVECPFPQCQGDAPPEVETCEVNDPDCDRCKVTIYGGKEFDGWDITLDPGNYSSAELEFRGVKCDDISSLLVVGHFCKVTGYEYGDFNTEHKGWSANFSSGKYNSQAILEKGGRDNDMSSLQIVFDKPPVEELPGGKAPKLMKAIRSGKLPDVKIRQPTKQDLYIVIGLGIIVGLILVLLVVTLWPSGAD